MVDRTVPYVDLAAQHAPLLDDLLAAAQRVIAGGQFILGDEVAGFEQEFAALCGTAQAVGVNSGTDALLLALRALGIGPGDEVICPPNSFVATAGAIALCGARPVYADVGDDYNLDPAAAEAAIGPRTKAILPVHLTGRPAPMPELLAIAARHGLEIVEDAAQAVMAELDGRRVGSFGRLGCFSCHPLKTLNACGDAGVITTDDAALAERLRVLRNLGLESRDRCIAVSGNSRLDALQAAILRVKLPHLADWTARRRANAGIYQTELADVPGLTVPVEREGERPAWHTFVIQADDRDGLRGALTARGIGSAVHYPVPIHLQPAYADPDFPAGSLPVAEAQAARIVSLPIHQGLSEDDVRDICAAIRAAVGA